MVLAIFFFHNPRGMCIHDKHVLNVFFPVLNR